ncbi:hypothetical protein LEP1GSC125_0918 [Leptospira mayottensis 200901122]|uniref:Uncharacterized protein n=1 Tax=Leptospira mayottensis 200901122 TaxID=1193010 RepID=A0AA87MU22_9LEPT|nr:hypothetical protein LEP1GSC125_0918 [Leptospira mayottensis 200901122]
MIYKILSLEKEGVSTFFQEGTKRSVQFRIQTALEIAVDSHLI